jgi:hypothetical protein
VHNFASWHISGRVYRKCIFPLADHEGVSLAIIFCCGERRILSYSTLSTPSTYTLTASDQDELGRYAVRCEDREGELQAVLSVEQVAPRLAVLFRRREALLEAAVERVQASGSHEVRGATVAQRPERGKVHGPRGAACLGDVLIEEGDPSAGTQLPAVALTLHWYRQWYRGTACRGTVSATSTPDRIASPQLARTFECYVGVFFQNSDLARGASEEGSLIVHTRDLSYTPHVCTLRDRY